MLFSHIFVCLQLFVYVSGHEPCRSLCLFEAPVRSDGDGVDAQSVVQRHKGLLFKTEVAETVGPDRDIQYDQAEAGTACQQVAPATGSSRIHPQHGALKRTEAKNLSFQSKENRSQSI